LRLVLSSATTLLPLLKDLLKQTQMTSFQARIFPSPLTTIEPFRDRPQVDRGVLRYLLRELRPLLMRASLLAFVGEFLLIASTIYSMRLLQEGNSPQDVALQTLLYLGSVLLGTYLGTRHACIFDAVDPLIRERIASLVATKLYRLDEVQPSLFGRSKLKNILDGDTPSLGRFFFSLFQALIPTLSALFFLVPAVYIIGGPPTLPALIIAPVPIFLSLWGAKLQHSIESRVKHLQDAFLGSIDQWIQNVRLVRGLGWNESLQGKVLEDARAVVREETKAAWIRSPLFMVSACWSLMGTSVYLASVYLHGVKIDIATSFGSMWLLTYLFSRLQFLPQFIAACPDAKVALQRLDEFLSLPEDQPAAGSDRKLTTIVIKRMKVQGDKGTILDIDELVLPLQQLIVITGSVASGKSTLLRILAGERQPDEGVFVGIFDDGSQVSLLTAEGRALLRASIAYQPQEFFTAKAKLSFNVSLRFESTLHDIEEALIKSEFMPDLETMGSTDIVIGEHGVNLSGGQKQRVVLARTLFTDRPLLILDDPFSALDASTQLLIANNLEREERGIILATHHPRLLKGGIRIALENGRVIQREAVCQ